eukprot:SAG11_NODE_4105_length_2063_cov_1.399185_2_plen_201_part_00
MDAPDEGHPSPPATPHLDGVAMDPVTWTREPKGWTIHPDGCFRRGWDAMQVTMLLYVAILVPVRTGFQQELKPGSWPWWLELATDLYFVADIFVNFRSAFYADGKVEDRPGEIAKAYLKSWFLLDFVSCLPTGYVEQILRAADDDDGSAAEAHGAGSSLKAFKVMRLLRLAKLLRLSKFKKMIKRCELGARHLAAARSRP